MRDTYQTTLITDSEDFGYIEWDVEYDATIASDGCVDIEPELVSAKPNLNGNIFYRLVKESVDCGQGNPAEIDAITRLNADLQRAFEAEYDNLAADVLSGAAERCAYQIAEARSDFPTLARAS